MLGNKSIGWGGGPESSFHSSVVSSGSSTNKKLNYVNFLSFLNKIKKCQTWAWAACGRNWRRGGSSSSGGGSAPCPSGCCKFSKKRKSLDLKGKRHTNSPNTASFYLSDKGTRGTESHCLGGGKLHSSFSPLRQRSLFSTYLRNLCSKKDDDRTVQIIRTNVQYISYSSQP